MYCDDSRSGVGGYMSALSMCIATAQEIHSPDVITSRLMTSNRMSSLAVTLTSLRTSAYVFYKSKKSASNTKIFLQSGLINRLKKWQPTRNLWFTTITTTGGVTSLAAGEAVSW